MVGCGINCDSEKQLVGLERLDDRRSARESVSEVSGIEMGGMANWDIRDGVRDAISRLVGPSVQVGRPGADKRSA